MNDDDLERRVSDYGSRWRDAHPFSNDVDTSHLTRSSRGKTIAAIVAAAVVVTAAIGVAAALRHNGSSNANPTAPSSTVVATTPTTRPPQSLTSIPAPPLPSTTASTTTTTRSAQSLLSALRSVPFDGSDLPAHLHVVGVGPWQYVDAGHVGNGYVGSAQVSLRSDIPGESIGGIYDVFTTAAAASASFSQAYTNFQQYSPVGSFQILNLNPAVRAFCGPQAGPPNTTTCWFEQGSTTANVTATTPTASGSGDSQTVLQAMLTHLVIQRRIAAG